MAEITIEQVIGQYLSLRDKVEALVEEANQKARPYDEAMKILENWLSVEMLRTGVTSFKADSGTAYKSTIRTTKVVDKEAFLAFIKETDEWNLAQVGASKKDIDEYIEEHHVRAIPGVETGKISRVNVRRS
jgi:hypothetical protein